MDIRAQKRPKLLKIVASFFWPLGTLAFAALWQNGFGLMVDIRSVCQTNKLSAVNRGADFMPYIDTEGTCLAL